MSSSSSFRAIRTFCSQGLTGPVLGQSFLSGYRGGPSEIHNDAFSPFKTSTGTIHRFSFCSQCCIFCLFARLAISCCALDFVNDRLQGSGFPCPPWKRTEVHSLNKGDSELYSCAGAFGRQATSSAIALLVSQSHTHPCDCSLRRSLQRVSQIHSVLLCRI